MLNTLYCSERIKPKLLREQKTEALLVFIRTILEDSIEDNDILKITSCKDTKIIQDTLLNLLHKLQKHVVNAQYLQYIRNNSNKNRELDILFNKEDPLIQYYNTLARGIVNLIPSGETWVPELIIISLLSEWILEEEKSVYLYPFLQNIDYTYLLSLFDKARNNIKTIDVNRYDFENNVIMNMYKVSSTLINKLEKSKFKVTRFTNKSKNKRKRKR